MSERRDPGSDQIHVRYTKWDGSLHWHFDADLIARDHHGTWVVVRPGGEYRRGTEAARVDDLGFVVLIPDREWWTAYFNAAPRGAAGLLTYVDINTPPSWHGPIVQMIDLDLDVVADRWGSARVIDEDEFIEHSSRFSYPPDVIARVRTTAARVHSAMESATEPFQRAGVSRVASSLGWVPGEVVAGHGVASGVAADPRFPMGTLAPQFPHFAAAGVPIEGMRAATINVDVPFELHPVRPRWTVENLAWQDGYPPEDFHFFDARIAIGSQVSPALVYRPDPSTKPEFHQPPTVIELLAAPLAGVAPGLPVSIWIDPAQAAFVVA